MFSIIGISLLIAQIFIGDLGCKYFMHPELVTDDDGDHDQCNRQHDLQGQLARCSIVDGDGVCRIDAGGSRAGNSPITPNMVVETMSTAELIQLSTICVLQ